MHGDSPRTNDFGQAYGRLYEPPICKYPVAWVKLDWKHKWYPELRDSYKSLINWGERNMKIKFINSVNLDVDEADMLRLFHERIAGRATRPWETWVLQYNEIAHDRGEIIFGYWEGELISGAMFIYGEGICVYWSGVYDRSQFDKPLAHYPLWLGMLRAKEHGMKWMDLGEIYQHGTDKEMSVSFFKRGFATHIFAPDYTPE